MKLSEYENEEALDLLADIIEPVGKIFADTKMQELKDKPLIELVQYVLKNYKSEIMQVLARLDNVPLEDYHCNAFTLPKKIAEFYSDAVAMDFFGSSVQSMVSTASGSVTENTEETEAQ